MRLSALIVCSMAAPIAFAAEPKPPSSLSADLDLDGKAETISWAKFATTEDDGDFYLLSVRDDDGTLLWQSPRTVDAEDEMAFGDWHFGYSLPHLAADIDGDRLIELVVPVPQSDVSPSYYRVFCWSRGKFEHVRTATLLRSKRDPSLFPWSKSEEYDGAWVSEFVRVNPDGTLLVEVFEVIRDQEPRGGQAVVAPAAEGLQVKAWAKPLAPFPDSPPPDPGPGHSDVAAAGGGVVYRARLSASDHFNSAGTRLLKVGDVLRQDRANYHKGKGDPDDGTDPLFGTITARGTMDSREVVPVGTTAAGLKAAVVGGTPLVEVRVTPAALHVKVLE